jgi:hypothetical protein
VENSKGEFPPFPPRLETRHKTRDSHIPAAATAAAVTIKIRQEKKNQNRTDHAL